MSINPITNKNFWMFPISKCFSLVFCIKDSSRCINILCRKVRYCSGTCLEISSLCPKNLQIICADISTLPSRWFILKCPVSILPMFLSFFLVRFADTPRHSDGCPPCLHLYVKVKSSQSQKDPAIEHLLIA